MKEEHRSFESLNKVKFYVSPILNLCDTGAALYQSS